MHSTADAALAAAIIITAFAQAPVLAGKADVVDAAAQKLPNGTYAFIATIRHEDESFDHFADRFDIVAPDGTVIASRPLNHPHIDEQPFTRALPGVRIKESITHVTVRAHDKLDGLGGKEVVVQLPGR